MNVSLTSVVENLLKKAQDEGDAVRAMNFAQAACNAANALKALMDAQRQSYEMSGSSHAP